MEREQEIELAQRIKTLEREREKAIAEVESFRDSGNEPVDLELCDLAIKEIEINAISCENYLVRLYGEGWNVEENLDRNERVYGNSVECRNVVNHVGNHFITMKRIPSRLKEGRFDPEFAEYY